MATRGETDLEGARRRLRSHRRGSCDRRQRLAHEDSISWGYGAEIAARIGSELFEYLDAPVKRVGALDTFVGYNPALEDAILPQVGTLAMAMRETARY